MLVALVVIPFSNAEAAFGDRILKQGMKGEDVKQLQRNLGALGYGVGKVDGIFGWKTFNTVKEFQWKNGLKADGIVGKNTSRAIIKQVSNISSQRDRVTELASRGNLKLSRQELYDLARVVHGEARGESFEGQVAVAAVVLNRLYSGEFGSNVQQVIFQPWAFTAVNDGQFYLEPNSSAYRAVDAAVKGWDPTGGAMYYWNPVTATSKWIWSRPIINKIGRHVFAT